MRCGVRGPADASAAVPDGGWTAAPGGGRAYDGETGEASDQLVLVGRADSACPVRRGHVLLALRLHLAEGDRMGTGTGEDLLLGDPQPPGRERLGVRDRTHR